MKDDSLLKTKMEMEHQHLGGGFKHVLFSPLFREDEPNLTNLFQMG